jgi:hypothetical protein
MTVNGPLMARDDRIAQPSARPWPNYHPIDKGFTVERVTRIELAWPAWKESARLPEPTRMRLLV